MDLQISESFFGGSIVCDCGRTHEIVPRRIIYHESALARLPGVVGQAMSSRHLVVLMDRRTAMVAGEAVLECLSTAGFAPHRLMVSDRPCGSGPICDDITLAVLKNSLAKQSPQLVLSVGSGVINDLGKWLACELKLPFITFATAASMNGYTSANIAPTVAGIKTLLHGNAPLAVLSAPAVLCEAPYALTSAGLGDVLAKSVSSADWRMNHLLFGDYYCARSVDLIAKLEPLYLEHPLDIAARKPYAMAALYEALLLTGGAMTMAGSSAPASGGEHMISHTLDMMSALDGQAHDFHGRQVGVGTVIASEVYRRVLAVESPRFAAPSANVDRTFWGPLADVVAKEYSAKLPRLAQMSAKLSQPDQWDALRAELAPMLRGPDLLRECLATASAAWRASDLGIEQTRLALALKHAHEIRSRVTVLDLAVLLGILPGSAGELVRMYA